MLKACIFLLIILQFTFAFCQNKKDNRFDKKWIAGIILLNDPSPINFKEFSPNLFAGVTLERHIKFLTILIGVEYVEEKFKSKPCPECRDRGYLSYELQEGMLRVGVSKGMVTKGFFKLYAASDFVFIKSFNDSFSVHGMTAESSETETDAIGFGVMPSIGVEFLVTSNISIGLESRWRFLK